MSFAVLESNSYVRVQQAHSPSGRMARSRDLPSDDQREDPRGLARPGIKLLEGLSRSQSEIRQKIHCIHSSGTILRFLPESFCSGVVARQVLLFSPHMMNSREGRVTQVNE